MLMKFTPAVDKKFLIMMQVEACHKLRVMLNCFQIGEEIP